MKITWTYIGDAHLLNIHDGNNWSLHAELDEYENAGIYLVLPDRMHQLADGSEILQGREEMLVDSYHVLEYYSAIVMRIADLIAKDNVQYINLEEIKDDLLRSHWWPKWLAQGLVTDDYCCADSCEITNCCGNVVS